jgi:hypothetical protein
MMILMRPLVLTPVNPSPRAFLLILSALSLGIAIHIRDGLVYPSAIAWLTISLATAFGAFIKWPDGSRIVRHSARALPWLICAALATQFLMLLLNRLPDAWHGAASTRPYYALILAASILCAALVRFRNRLIFLLILLTFAFLGFWVLSSGQRPRIDVWTAQMAGLDAIRHGADPWSSSFADVYHIPDLYAPGTVRDGIVHLGFPYPPLTVLLDLPGYVLFNDYRYSNLAAMILTAVFIAYAKPGRIGPLAATLFLFTPRAFLVLRNGWTEPQVAMLLSATVFCACRFPRAMPWVLGLFLVSKQYLPLAVLPAMLLIWPKWNLRDAARLLGKAALAGAAVSLPLALWNTHAFLHSTFLVASGAKFRLDALSYFAYYANVRDWTPPQWLGSVSFFAALATGGMTWRRAERSAAGFAAGVAIVFLVFFSLNKFAFCNYYYFIIAALCASVAATSSQAQTAAKADSDPHEFALAA